jgi:hypothetical protein
MHGPNLEKQLLDAGYPGLFLYGDRGLDASIWDNGRHKGELEMILMNNLGSSQSKFLAAEVLKKYGSAISEEVEKSLPVVYVAALKNSSDESGNQYRLNGNAWGRVATGDIGPLGERILSFGDRAIPYLKVLLKDEAIILFDGSQEAMVGNEFQYRVKDFAAFFISRIKNIPLVLERDKKARDSVIERLMNTLNE